MFRVFASLGQQKGGQRCTVWLVFTSSLASHHDSQRRLVWSTECSSGCQGCLQRLAADSSSGHHDFALIKDFIFLMLTILWCTHKWIFGTNSHNLMCAGQRLFHWVSNIRGVCVVLSAFESRNDYNFDMFWHSLPLGQVKSVMCTLCAYDLCVRWKTFSQQEIFWSKQRIGLRSKAPKRLWKEWLSSTPSMSWTVGVAALWTLIWNDSLNITFTVCDWFCDEEEHDSMINSSTINLLVGTAGM